jgi:5-hydroxyisourate hydrolase
MPGYLTTHVLDVALGKPAVGIRYRLYRMAGESRTLMSEGATNADGRADTPLLTPQTIQPGPYALQYDAAAYHRSAGIALLDPPFLDIVELRFSVSELDQHYHIPLLLAPYSYSTYRGS